MGWIKYREKQFFGENPGCLLGTLNFFINWLVLCFQLILPLLVLGIIASIFGC
jgi:hypothetical protein